jgi:hypothetical protein
MLERRATIATEDGDLPDLRVADLDADGALQEAVAGVYGQSRAEFLRTALVGGSALLAALGAPTAQAAEAVPASDVAILNYALTLEYLQAAFYTEAERAGALSGDVAPVPRQVGAVERAHVAALQDVLGRNAVKRPFFNFRGTTENQRQFLRTAVAFEDLSVAAYKAQATRVKSPAVLAAAVSIHSVEARHAAWMRYLVGITPSASAFDEGRPEAEVRQIVASTRFIVSRPRKSGEGAPRFTG